MIPRKIALRNFMCYREGLPPLDLDGINIACLAGENGSGKSALLDAMTWALWGEARLSSDELIALGAADMEVELIFTLDGQDYRVIRKRSKGKRVGQTWLEFQARNGEGWKPIGESGVRETQEAINRTLRMDYELFANSAYLRQGHADEFTRKEPARRKEVLAGILGLQAYEELEARSKERARSLDGQVKSLEGHAAALRQQAEKREVYIAELRRAEELLAELEGRRDATTQLRAVHAGGDGVAAPAGDQAPAARLGGRAPRAAATNGQLSLFDVAPSPALELLKRLNINELTPLDALNKLYELQKLAASE